MTDIIPRYDDLDNGDGVHDGAMAIDGRDANGPLGVLYTFDGVMGVGETYSLKTSTYNYKTSFVEYQIELFNLNDGVVLAATGYNRYPRQSNADINRIDVYHSGIGSWRHPSVTIYAERHPAVKSYGEKIRD